MIKCSFTKRGLSSCIFLNFDCRHRHRRRIVVTPDIEFP